MNVGDAAVGSFVNPNWDVLWCCGAKFDEVVKDLSKTDGHVNGFATCESLSLTIVTILLVSPGQLDPANA